MIIDRGLSHGLCDYGTTNKTVLMILLTFGKGSKKFEKVPGMVRILSEKKWYIAALLPSKS